MNAFDDGTDSLPQEETIMDDTQAQAKLATIRNQQAKVDKAAAYLDDCKEAAKAAREAWEGAVEDLGDLIRDQPKLPLEQND